MNRNIFIAMTPYHIFLILCYKYRTNRDILVIFDEYNLLEDYSKIKSQKFSKEVYVSGGGGIVNRLCSLILELKRIALSINNEIISDKTLPKLHIFNDSSIHIQYLIRHLKYADCIYMEDGSAPYNDHYIKHSLLKKYIGSIIFGSSFKLPSVVGTSSAVSLNILTHPSLVRNENELVPSIQYQSNENIPSEVISYFENHPRINSIKRVSTKNDAALLLLPKMNEKNIEIENKFTSIARELSRKKIAVIIKRHPLDVHLNLTNLSLGEIDVPNSIPAEIIPYYIKCLSSIYSIANTALLSYAHFHKNIVRNCVITKQNHDLNTLFQNINKTGSNLIF